MLAPWRLEGLYFWFLPLGPGNSSLIGNIEVVCCLVYIGGISSPPLNFSRLGIHLTSVWSLEGLLTNSSTLLQETQPPQCCHEWIGFVMWFGGFSSYLPKTTQHLFRNAILSRPTTSRKKNDNMKIIRNP